MSKPKVAFVEFADCEGCQLEVVNLGAEFLKLARAVDIVAFREIMSERAARTDVLVVEGSVASRHDEERLREIAGRAKTVVALGACATTGGVNRLKNLKPLAAQKRTVYGKVDPVPDAIATKAIDEVVRVDYYVHGCPIYGPEFLKVMECVLLGKPYHVPNYPVCVECKQNENVCAYEKGQFCLGPVTRAGCNSWMINHGSVCLGCRGLLADPATGAQKDILLRYGLTVEGILSHFSLYGNGQNEKSKNG
jgi:sulfhydrogenase subunit delta